MKNTSTLVAGTACLELVNTINDWHAPRRDTLAAPATATDWSATVLSVSIEPLGKAAIDDLRSLRASVREVFRAIAAHVEPGPKDVTAVMSHHRRGVAAARLDRLDSLYELTWADLSRHVAAPFAADAVRLLLQGPLERVGECPSCGWLFVDTSKNARRTWCSMRTCGARDKAKRRYRRTHHGTDDNEIHSGLPAGG